MNTHTVFDNLRFILGKSGLPSLEAAALVDNTACGADLPIQEGLFYTKPIGPDNEPALWCSNLHGDDYSTEAFPMFLISKLIEITWRRPEEGKLDVFFEIGEGIPMYRVRWSCWDFDEARGSSIGVYNRQLGCWTHGGMATRVLEELTHNRRPWEERLAFEDLYRCDLKLRGCVHMDAEPVIERYLKRDINEGDTCVAARAAARYMLLALHARSAFDVDYALKCAAEIPGTLTHYVALLLENFGPKWSGNKIPYDCEEVALQLIERSLGNDRDKDVFRHRILEHHELVKDSYRKAEKAPSAVGA